MDPKAYKPQDFRWSQRDKRWANKKLGASKLTVGGYGCAVLCTTYVIDRFLKDKKEKTLMPNEVIDKATFTPNGLLYWNIVGKITKNRLVQVYDKTKADYTLMMVWWGTMTHWVVLLNGDLCYDPWDGAIKKRKQPHWKTDGGFVYYKKA